MDWTSLSDALNSAALAAFGREITYVTTALEEITLSGIFETVHQEDRDQGRFAVLWIREADLIVEGETVPRQAETGATVQIENNADPNFDSYTYKVFQVESDGHGGVRLGLHQMSGFNKNGYAI